MSGVGQQMHEDLIQLARIASSVSDVCSVSFEVVVKNAAFEVVASDEFDNYHDGFVQFLHRIDTLSAWMRLQKS
ncbi:hypothetical protein IH992_26095 [Candidatus Poribacteria bacterium]|nr:hypothetical protein [Candidatus Poribacteria bacterium]